MTHQRRRGAQKRHWRSLRWLPARRRVRAQCKGKEGAWSVAGGLLGARLIARGVRTTPPRERKPNEPERLAEINSLAFPRAPSGRAIQPDGGPGGAWQHRAQARRAHTVGQDQPGNDGFRSLPYARRTLRQKGPPRKLAPYLDQAGNAARRSGGVVSNRALTFAIDCCFLNRTEMWGGGSKMWSRHQKLQVGIIFLAVMAFGCEGQAQNLTTRTTGCLGSGGNFSLLRIG